MQVLIESEFQNTIQKYKNQLEEVSSTASRDTLEIGKLETSRKN